MSSWNTLTAIVFSALCIDTAQSSRRKCWSLDWADEGAMKLSCGQFGGDDWVILVEQILYMDDSTCWEWNDHGCSIDVTSQRQDILAANGKVSWPITDHPNIPSNCSATHVLVKYDCINVMARKNMCEDLFILRSVDIATPQYSRRSTDILDHDIACECSAVNNYGGIEFSLLDSNFTTPGAECEEYLYTNFTNSTAKTSFRNINFACSNDYRPPFALHFSNGSNTVSFTIMYVAYNGTNMSSSTRGAWFRIKALGHWMTLTCKSVDPGELTPPTRPPVTAATSPATPPSNSVSNAYEQKQHRPFIEDVGALAGGVVGILLLSIMCALTLYTYRRNRKDGESPSATDSPRAIPNSFPPNTSIRPPLRRRTDSVHEYFEPLGENIYSIPEHAEGEFSSTNGSIYQPRQPPTLGTEMPNGVTSAHAYQNEAANDELSNYYHVLDDVHDYVNTGTGTSSTNGYDSHDTSGGYLRLSEPPASTGASSNYQSIRKST